jgi:hypothetical protein
VRPELEPTGDPEVDLTQLVCLLEADDQEGARELARGLRETWDEPCCKTMTRVTTLTWGMAGGPPVTTGIFRLGDDGVVRLEVLVEDARHGLESFMTDGAWPPFETERFWPVDGERFLQALVRLNRNSSYVAYAPDRPE